MSEERGVEDGSAPVADFNGNAAVDVVRCAEAESAVTMLVVVPVEEAVAVGARVRASTT